MQHSFLESILNPQKQAHFFSACLRLILSYVNHEGAVIVPSSSLTQSRRLTHQYITASLASGVHPKSTILQKSLKWLVESGERSSLSNQEDHYVVLDKIDAAIEMGEVDTRFCKSAMELLTKRRDSPTRFRLPGEHPQTFHAMWAAKIYLTHPDPRYHALGRETIGELQPGYRNWHARDLSFFLRLYQRSYPARSLREKPYKLMLSRLLDMLGLGLCDFPNELRDRWEELRAQGVGPDLVLGFEDDIYWSLISTCYAVENLKSFSLRSKRVRETILLCLRTLCQFLDPSKISIAASFPEPYRQIMISARLVTSLAHHGQQSVAAIVLPLLFQELAERDKARSHRFRHEDKSRLQKVLKSWLQIEWDDSQEQRLGGGYSGATIVRILPRLKIPGDFPDGSRLVEIPNLPSAIVKYGRKADLDKERQNYLSIPPDYRHLFAAVPAPSHKEIVENEVIEYLIIEDLTGFKTIQELFAGSVSKEFVSVLEKRLFEFFVHLYSMPIAADARSGMLLRLYITPMFRSLETIHEFKQKRNALTQRDRSAFGFFEAFLSHAEEIERFPVSVMHGDLNIRNVLLHGKQEAGAEIRFRLIDLDKFSRAGDLAYDVGEFITDTQLVERFTVTKTSLGDFRNGMERKFFLYAETRGDSRFGLRMALGRARSLLKMAEIQSRLGLKSFGPLGRQRVEAELNKVEEITEQAYEVLSRSVLELQELSGKKSAH